MKYAIACLFLICLVSTLAARVVTTEVVAADPQARTLSLADGRVVKVARGDAQIGYVGHQIRGDLKREDGEWRMDYIWPADPKTTEVAAEVNRQLRENTLERGRKVLRSVGETIPDFAFYDENGELVTASTLKGKNLVMNFIFTRCNVPTMCPAATARMARLQREIDEADLRHAELVTVSFDPEYDTPGILRLYGEQRGIHFDNYTFLTGDAEAIKDFMRQMGILVIAADDDTLNHTMATLLIDDQGKILYRKEGARWDARDYVERLQELERIQQK